MTGILVVVAALEPGRMRSAVAEAARLHGRDRTPVVVLNVQPQVNGHVAGYFGRQELEQLQQQAGLEDLAPACALLDLAGVAYSKEVRVGRTAEVVAATARAWRCDRIVLGEAPGTPLARTVFGSLADQVRALVAGGGCVVIGS